MNVVCTSNTCDFIISSKCAFYEGAALPYIGIATNSTLESSLQSIENAVKNIVSSGISPVWGSITGTITDQTDLITYLSSNYYPSTNPNNYIDCAGVPACETDPVFSAWLAGPPNLSEFTNNSGYITLVNLSATSPITYNNGTGVISSSMSTGKLIGRYSAGTGIFQEINISTGLSLDGSGNLTTTGSGTVTSVAALTIGTSGTDLSSSVANPTTTPVITLNVPTASATNRGALSSSDWSIFNGKQSTISLTTTGTSGAATFIANTLNIPQYQAAGTYVTSVSGTLDRISSTGGTTPVIDIASTYVGQTSIITVGTLTTGATGAGFTINLGTSTISGDLPFANLTQGSARSVLGVTGNSTADFASIQGTTDQVLRVDGAGISLSFGSIDLSKSATVGSSILGAANGGTGIANNAASTITISGNFATTFTITGITGVTLPTTGTLATLAGAESLTNKKLGSLTTNGFVKTSSSDGTLSVDTNTYQASGLSWLLASGGALTGHNTISGNFDKYFSGTGGFVIGHTALTTANTRLQVRGTGATTNINFLLEDSAGVARMTYLDNGIATYTQAAQSATNVMSTWTQAIHTGGSPTIFTIVGGAHTGLALATEAPDIYFNLARTVQFTTGAGLTLQRAIIIGGPTWSATASKTIATAVTLDVDPPVQGTNMTLTNTWAIRSNGRVLVTGAASSTKGSIVVSESSSSGKILLDLQKATSVFKVLQEGQITSVLATPTTTNAGTFDFSGTNTFSFAATNDHTSLFKIAPTITLSNGVDATNLYSVLRLSPSITATSFVTGIGVYGIYYNPSFTSLTLPHYAIATASGKHGLGTLTPTNFVDIVQPVLTASWASVFKTAAGAHTGMTAATEFVSVDFTGATQTWADGTVTIQRFNYFRGYTANKTTTSATFTDIYNVYIDTNTAGSGVTFTRNWALGVNGNLAVAGSTYHGALGVAPTAFLHVAAGVSGNAQIRLAPGIAPSSPNDGDIYYVDTNDRLMFRKNATDAEILSASAQTTETVVSDATITTTFNGVTVKLLIKT